MKRTNALKTSAVLVLLSSLAFSSMAFDMHKHKGEHGKQGYRMEKMLRALDLSDAQRAQIKEIRSNSKQQLEALAPEKKEHRQELQAIIKADSFDENAFLALQNETAQKRQQAGLIRAKTMHQIYHVLDADQQAKFEKMQQKRKQRN
ncbi:Spy/CpxP family protein refolding chaperone [Thalassotalea sp. PS06]|uniref:Spy/CpxP family protein refolding chaperone n=1 Tax=Thalassotalea sp. PS06 TaxID=2594005 RepID=UPI001C8F5C7F|nr:Spy/CpxP family protein refolding chaperone [Thalassotalea sp. PS06]